MYSFSVYASPITFPFCFAVHTWVVLESPDFGIKRYDIHSFINKKTGTYLYINAQAPEEGMPFVIIPRKYSSKKRFGSKKIFTLTGENAKEAIETLEKNIYDYPFLHMYHLYPGPNSNTFVRWVLNLCVATKEVRLPWNAFGERFPLKKLK